MRTCKVISRTDTTAEVVLHLRGASFTRHVRLERGVWRDKKGRMYAINRRPRLAA